MSQVPIVEDHYSNAPNYYLDTRVADPSYLKSFTVGFGRGEALQSGVTYSSYIRVLNGTASVDNGFLQGQWSWRDPSWCYTTWCLYAGSGGGPSHISIYPEYEVDPIPGIFSWEVKDLNETLWRGSSGYGRPVFVDATSGIQWDISPSWSTSTPALNGLSGDIQTLVNYRVGDILVQGYWKNNQGWTRNVPINSTNDTVQWGSAPVWSGPISTCGFPVGCGATILAHGDAAVPNEVIQAIWFDNNTGSNDGNNSGYFRYVPILSNGLPDWNNPGAWQGPVGLPANTGSGDIQAQDNFIVGNTYWQTIWRNNHQYTRSAPIINGSVDFGQASSFVETTSQEDLPGSGNVRAQGNYVLP